MLAAAIDKATPPAATWRPLLMLALGAVLLLVMTVQFLSLERERHTLKREAAQLTWALADIILEMERVREALTGWEANDARRDQAALRFEMLWSRIDNLETLALARLPAVGDTVQLVETVLRDADPLLYATLPPADAEIGALATRLDDARDDVRRLWMDNSADTPATRAVWAETRRHDSTIRAMGITILATAALLVAYLAFRLRKAQQAQARMDLLSRRAQAASRAKGDFLAMVSHEVRTPLNGVMGMTAALRDEPLSESQAEMVEVIHDSGEALLRTIDDVLDLSRMEASRLSLEIVAMDPAALVRSLAALYKPSAEAKGLDLKLRLPDESGARYMGDPARLRQILGNLLGNAVKFTSEGVVVMEMAVDEAARDDQSDRLTFRVSDTGIGIDHRALKRIFEPFTQASESTSRQFGGSGLGLSICRRIADLMDAQLNVESAPGAGSTFTLSLDMTRASEAAETAETGQDAGGPLNRIEPPARPIPVQPAAGTRRLGQTRQDAMTQDTPNDSTDAADPAPRVLVVDDNSTNRMVVERLLKGHVGHIVSVADGQAAVDRVRAETFDLVFMDIQMPGMDGIAATRAIIADAAARGATPPVIHALTANVLPEQREGYLAAGMAGCLAKPVGKSALLPVIASVRGTRSDTGSDTGSDQSTDGAAKSADQGRSAA